MAYVLNQTKDHEEIRKLYEGNLRGEGGGELIRESDIIKENKMDESNIEFGREGGI